MQLIQFGVANTLFKVISTTEIAIGKFLHHINRYIVTAVSVMANY